MSGLDALGRFLDHGVARGRMPGAVWCVADGDGVRSAGAIGHAALEPRPAALTEETPFDLASLTKPLCTALLLVLLEAERRLDSTLPAQEWLPELRGSAAGAATLSALAVHRSGLPAWRPLYVDSTGSTGVLERVAALPAEKPPVTRYSDPGYIVLGAALERATGQTLDELFRRRIAGPLGLARTGFATPREAFEDAAATETGNEYERELAGAEGAGHRFRETIPRGQVHDGNAHALGGIAGHAGLFGTAGEVAAVGREILAPRILPLDPGSRGRLLRPGGEAGDRTVGFLAAADAGAARGVLPDRAVGHVGFTGTSIWLDPERERVLVLLTNRVHPRVPEADFRWVRRGFHRLAASV